MVLGELFGVGGVEGLFGFCELLLLEGEFGGEVGGEGGEGGLEVGLALGVVGLEGLELLFEGAQLRLGGGGHNLELVFEVGNHHFGGLALFHQVFD